MRGECRHCRRVLLIAARRLCKTCYRDVRDRYPRSASGRPDDDNTTEAEVEALVAAGLANKPKWWDRESPPESRTTLTPGRTAEAVKTKSGRVFRKGRRV